MKAVGICVKKIVGTMLSFSFVEQDDPLRLSGKTPNETRVELLWWPLGSCLDWARPNNVALCTSTVCFDYLV